MMTMMMDGLDDSNDFCNLFFSFLLGRRFLALALGMAWMVWVWVKGEFSYLLVFVSSREFSNYGSYTV